MKEDMRLNSSVKSLYLVHIPKKLLSENLSWANRSFSTWAFKDLATFQPHLQRDIPSECFIASRKLLVVSIPLRCFAQTSA